MNRDYRHRCMQVSNLSTIYKDIILHLVLNCDLNALLGEDIESLSLNIGSNMPTQQPWKQQTSGAMWMNQLIDNLGLHEIPNPFLAAPL